MLNEALPDELKNKKVEAQYDEKFKIVLEGEEFVAIVLPGATVTGDGKRFCLLLCSQKKDRIISKFCQKAGSK